MTKLSVQSLPLPIALWIAPLQSTMTEDPCEKQYQNYFWCRVNWMIQYWSWIQLLLLIQLPLWRGLDALGSYSKDDTVGVPVQLGFPIKQNPSVFTPFISKTYKMSNLLVFIWEQRRWQKSYNNILLTLDFKFQI